MKTCYVNVKPKEISEVLQGIQNEDPDSVLVLAPVNGCETIAPTRKKNYFRIKFEAVIPKDVIAGDACLYDFGCIPVLRLPKERINPIYLGQKEQEEGINLRQSVWQRLTVERLREIDLKRQAYSNLCDRLRYLEGELQKVKGPVLSTTPVSGGMLNKEEERRLNNISLRAELTTNAQKLKREINTFNKAWEQLTEKEQLVLTYFFIMPQKNCVERLMDQLGCEARKIYYLRNEALYKLTVLLYGA